MADPTPVEQLVAAVQALQAVLEEQRPHLTQDQRKRVHDACSAAQEAMARDIAERFRRRSVIDLAAVRRLLGRR